MILISVEAVKVVFHSFSGLDLHIGLIQHLRSQLVTAQHFDLKRQTCNSSQFHDQIPEFKAITIYENITLSLVTFCADLVVVCTIQTRRFCTFSNTTIIFDNVSLKLVTLRADQMVGFALSASDG